MKKIILILTFLISLQFNSVSQSNCSTISDGTYGNTQTSPYMPLYGLYNYGWSSSIYNSVDIGDAKDITQISWYVDAFQNGYSQSGPYTFSNVKIYFAYTTLNGWTNVTNVGGTTRPIGINVPQGITSWTKVYDGSIIFNASNAWKYITLDTPFSYNGTSNLIVHVENWDGSYSSGYPIFHYTSTSSTSYRTEKYGYQDGSMATSGSVTGARYYTRPDIQFCEPISLPIELLYFKGVPSERHNHLTWSTASEHNNHYFEIEKTLDGIEFNTINRINGSGNSQTKIDYKFDDYNIDNNINYYRLKQVDFDGKFQYSDVISIDNRIRAKIVSRMVSLMGTEVNEMYRGMVIVEYTDGSIEKIIR